MTVYRFGDNSYYETRCALRRTFGDLSFAGGGNQLPNYEAVVAPLGRARAWFTVSYAYHGQ
jgi:hypothetical protein